MRHRNDQPSSNGNVMQSEKSKQNHDRDRKKKTNAIKIHYNSQRKKKEKKNNPEHNKTREITIQANSMVRKIQILHNLCDSL